MEKYEFSADRRGFPRILSGYPVDIEIENPPSGIPSSISGEIGNVSSEGASLILDSSLPVFSLVTLRIDLSPDYSQIETKAQVMWSYFLARNKKFNCGVRFLDLGEKHREVLNKLIGEGMENNKSVPQRRKTHCKAKTKEMKVIQAVSNRENEGKDISERRKGRISMGFPVYRRKEDEIRIINIDPHTRLLDNLRQVGENKKIENILVASNLSYLIPKIKKSFPASKVVVSGCKEGAPRGLLCILDLSNIVSHQSYTLLTFEELLSKTAYLDEPLTTLTLASRLLKPQAQITFVSLGRIKNSKNVKKILMSTKFTNIRLKGSNIIQAEKRKLIKHAFDKGRLIIEEIISPSMINMTEEFSQKYYRKYNYNFRIEIDDLFSPYSDYFVCYKVTNKKIICVARHVWHIPNHFLPLMLATKKGTDAHLELNQPDKYRYGETSGIYEQTYSGVKSYKESMKVLLNHLTEMGIDAAFTTYEEKDIKTGKLYKESYGFKETGVTLEYGKFGGSWVLLCGSKKDVIPTMKLKFISR